MQYIKIFLGETHTYTWYVTNTAGPTEQQETCSVMAYYSTVDMVKVGLCQEAESAVSYQLSALVFPVYSYGVEL